MMENHGIILSTSGKHKFWNGRRFEKSSDSLDEYFIYSIEEVTAELQAAKWYADISSLHGSVWIGRYGTGFQANF